MTDAGGFGRADVARCWAGFASLGAGLIHLAVVHEHFKQWWVFGVFFAVVGTAQILWALAALARDLAPLLRLVGAGNLLLVALWVVTRTVGIPIGPEPWTAEAAGRSDVLCIALEIGTAAALFVAARSAGRRNSTPRDASTTAPVVGAGRFVALMFVGALAVSAITTPALAATESGTHTPAMPGMHM